MPRPVTLVPHDPAWAARAEGLIAAIDAAVPGVFGAVHHMGSTAIPGLAAKPVIDLLAEVEALETVEGARGALAGLGWRWRGENGLAGRRYFTRDDPETGTRAAHLHVYASGDPAIAWHLAFRDRLRAEPATADAYAREKTRCAALHPDDSAAYAACKKAWTDGVAAEAVRGWRRRKVGCG
ncbi:GrpB family protein [Brevundimonas sp.]|uniref:GrpB family protein n=1 Tax=Brevundimonas sp. TaxID=1871086 RepID=UPI002735AD82|nr:GrpB family protein [Brevundimonas sp.]